MKICKRMLEWVQIIDYKGTVRLCSWINDNVIGSLSENTLEEIYHSEHARQLRKKLAVGDYSDCIVDACPYLAMNTIGEHLVELDEVPKCPEKLCLAFEEVCNYKCISCTTPNVMCGLNREEVEKGYDVIEEKLKDVLPYIKTISTNGRGEIFVSKRTLKMLSEWKPLAPKEEITVEIETNGSLFDEKHWKQIENLGEYNVRVAVTVMSFDEETYQLLSGCELPIGQIENNLRYIKKLREQGVVNYFEIATVVQERNFRTLPEFTRRCVEEFGADYVRLRPYMPWGSQEPHVEWFMNVRNKRHPYYNEYRKMWRDPIFQNPKVHDWSGGLDDECIVEFPYKMELMKKEILKDMLVCNDRFADIFDISMNNRVVIYGLGEIGKAIINYMALSGIQPLYIIDQYVKESQYNGLYVYKYEEMPQKDNDVTILITTLTERDKIESSLIEHGFDNMIFLVDRYR